MNMGTKADPAEQWSLGGLVRVEACPACGSTARLSGGMVCNDPTIHLKDDLWNMQACSNCRSLYLDPRPDPVSLALAYREYETHSEAGSNDSSAQQKSIIWALVNGYLNSRFKLARSNANAWGSVILSFATPWKKKLDYYCRHLYPERFGKRRRLLDVGCGNGAFLSIAHEMGWDVLGLDPDPVGVELCKKRGMAAVQGTLANLLPEHESRFEAVTMSHSIEHLDGMRQELARAFRLLHPGGVLWLATPNPESFGARWFGRAWRGLRPPYHLCIPSQQALHELLRASGFVDIEPLRRGVHARKAFRETARNVTEIRATELRMLGRLAPFIAVLSDLMATVSVAYAEETVLTARKPDL